MGGSQAKFQLEDVRACQSEFPQHGCCCVSRTRAGQPETAAAAPGPETPGRQNQGPAAGRQLYRAQPGHQRDEGTTAPAPRKAHTPSPCPLLGAKCSSIDSVHDEGQEQANPTDSGLPGEPIGRAYPLNNARDLSPSSPRMPSQVPCPQPQYITHISGLTQC